MKQPAARILLSPIFPRQASPKHRQRVRNDWINGQLHRLADGDKVVWLDFNSRFLTKDGVLTRELFPDLLHPAAEGYRIWLDAVSPYFKK